MSPRTRKLSIRRPTASENAAIRQSPLHLPRPHHRQAPHLPRGTGMGFASILALVLVAAAIVLIVRGWDVRLVLLAAALMIGTVAGDAARVVREFLATFSNEKFVVPICAAMGFAYVLRHTGCERHLVLLLYETATPGSRTTRTGRDHRRLPGQHSYHQPDEYGRVHRSCGGTADAGRRILVSDHRSMSFARCLGRRGVAQPRCAGVAHRLRSDAACHRRVRRASICRRWCSRISRCHLSSSGR